MKTTHGLFSTIIWAYLSIALLSCANPWKYIERGDYDRAVEIAVKRLAGKKHKKEKHVKALEEAFELATKRDMREIELLKREGREENWVEINNIVRRIKQRQEKVEALLPLFDKHGYKANFRFVKVDELELESKAKAADYYYNEGRRLLAQAEQGDKYAAREAYHMFEQLKYYYKRYKDEDELMKKALELGKTYVLFDIRNHSNVVLPREVERELRKFELSDLNKRWLEIHNDPRSRITYDYNVVLYITGIDVSPELIKEREYTDTKEVEKGWEYLLDENGNVKKDSAGNDIKVPKKVQLKAQVLETYQHKAAAISAILEIYDNADHKLIRNEPLTVEVAFENYAATFKGDKEALSPESKTKIGNNPLPFPSNEQLILEALDKLKPIVKDKLRAARLDRLH